jgi:hypothetical protein
MGSHFALYATTELAFKFAGVILHDTATLPTKKEKLSTEEWKTLASYLPSLNLQRAGNLSTPTMLIHTANAEKLDELHCEKLRKMVCNKFLAKGKVNPTNPLKFA